MQKQLIILSILLISGCIDENEKKRIKRETQIIDIAIRLDWAKSENAKHTSTTSSATPANPWSSGPTPPTPPVPLTPTQQAFALLILSANNVALANQTPVVDSSRPYTVTLPSLNPGKINQLNTAADQYAAAQGTSTVFWLDQYRKNTLDYETYCTPNAFPVTFTSTRTAASYTVNNSSECAAATNDQLAIDYYVSGFGWSGQFPANFQPDGTIQTLYGSVLAYCRAIPGSNPLKPNCEQYE